MLDKLNLGSYLAQYRFRYVTCGMEPFDAKTRLNSQWRK